MNCITCQHKELLDKDAPVLLRKDGSNILCSLYRCFKRPGRSAYDREQEHTDLWISEEGEVWEEAQKSIIDCEYHSSEEAKNV